MKDIPEILTNKIKTNVHKAKQLLESDPVFANKIFSMICNVNHYTPGVVSNEVYKHYTKDKFPQVQEVYEVVDILGHLATGHDIDTLNLIDTEFTSYDELGIKIREQINTYYDNNINLLKSDPIGKIPETYDEDFL